MRRTAFAAIFGMALAGLAAGSALAASGEKPRDIIYPVTPPAPYTQMLSEADNKSEGCLTCHEKTDAPTMHYNPAVVLGCTDCHGGNPEARWNGAPIARKVGHGDGHGAKADEHHDEDFAKLYGDPEYFRTMEEAHVLPRYPQSWHWPKSANPERPYTLYNRESPEYVRFVNPGDYRVVREACGACHLPIIEKAERSIMASGAMLWGGGAYNNGILPYKNYLLGEAYTREGKPASIVSPPLTERAKARGAIAQLFPLPAWETVPAGDVFRVFEKGGRNILTQFPEVGLPNIGGIIQRLEEPGRPDIRQSSRGPGTGLRVAIPVLNITKTRLNDPNMWFAGTNDQPGDFRASGCSACHVPYANDRDWYSSNVLSKFGNVGHTQTIDPTIPHGESGHPLKHAFTRAIPTSTCMNCHMHQPNMFENTYLGFTMWDYESDAPLMWPEKQVYPHADERLKVLTRNPEAASPIGKWADIEFVKEVWTQINPQAKDTQFADYHGHGWNFRGIFSRDRKGNLLDKNSKVVANDDPEKWEKTVHMRSIHAEVGMQCADCHFSQDAHGNGYIYTEVMNAVEIRCKDCHGTSQAYPNLRTSGTASPPKGNDLSLIRNMDGQPRFEWDFRDGRRVLIQHSIMDPKLEWEVSLVKDSVDPDHPKYNAKAARAKLMSKGQTMNWGPGIASADQAHNDDEIECYACHFSWTTSCGGCHLPIEANFKTERHHYEGGETRNFATYNPQVVRDQMYQLGKHMTTKNNTIAPVRSSSALVLSSTNINRERIYVQQPPVASSGYSSQAFAPHFPHTVRKTETRQCEDCHLSDKGDNNAIMSQLLLLGTNFVNFVGMHAYVGLDGGVQAMRVTEYDEPQAVLGSYLQKYAFPDYYARHLANGGELKEWVRRSGPNNPFASDEVNTVEEFANPYQSGGRAGCLQHRGEYLYTADGTGGFIAYDIASIANKGISDRILTGPFSPLGHNTRVKSSNATCVALSTTQPVHPARNTAFDRSVNQEQPFHPIYNYAVVTDSEEGIYLVDINTLSDGEPLNNFLTRAVTWNGDGLLKGAHYIKLAGFYAYIAADAGLVVVNLDDPLKPKTVAVLPLRDVRGIDIQFRYAFVTTAAGMEVVDITHLETPRVVAGAQVRLADAQRIYVARTYAYVAAGRDGLAIIDVETPERPHLYMTYNADGRMNDARDVVVGTTNASLFAYVADGANGLKVVQLTSPSSQPNFYGFSPEPRPELIAWGHTRNPALALSKGMDRDRAVDETGFQMAVFGRLGSRPFTRKEMEDFFLDRLGNPWTVTNRTQYDRFVPTRATRNRKGQEQANLR